MLESTGLLHLGPGPAVEVLAIIDSGEVGVAKPDARIFDHALAAVGNPAPEFDDPPRGFNAYAADPADRPDWWPTA